MFKFPFKQMNLGRAKQDKFRKNQETRPGVDKVKPKVLLKYSLQIDY